MVKMRELLSLHINGEEFIVTETRGKYLEAYAVVVDGKLRRLFTDIFECAKYLLETYGEVNK